MSKQSVTKVTDALKQVTRYTYDKNGNLLSETDALGNTVEYAYTPEGWLSAIIKADGTVLTFAYNKTGNLLTQNTGENQNIESSYNEIGQVTTVTSSARPIHGLRALLFTVWCGSMPLRNVQGNGRWDIRSLIPRNVRPTLHTQHLP